MTTTDESQNLDAGWDDAEPAGDPVDQAWDSMSSVPVSVSSSVPVSAGAPSIAPKTEEVDVGWDDVPAGVPGRVPGPAHGKRRPHRQRREKSNVVAASANPVLLPRPAEPQKKHQREHARQLRAREAQVKEERKLERKAQRAAEMREENAARLRQTEAEGQARKMRREARERAESERPKQAASSERAQSSRKSAAKNAASHAVEVKRKESPAHSTPPKRGLRLAVIITVFVLAMALGLLLLRK